jgi:hypothetical protein
MQLTKTFIENSKHSATYQPQQEKPRFALRQPDGSPFFPRISCFKSCFTTRQTFSTWFSRFHTPIPFSDEFNKPSIVKLRIPSVFGAPLNQAIDIQGNRHVLRQLSKVRYDFVHIPKIDSGKGAVHIIEVTEMSRAFLSTMQVLGGSRRSIRERS